MTDSCGPCFPVRTWTYLDGSLVLMPTSESFTCQMQRLYRIHLRYHRNLGLGRSRIDHRPKLRRFERGVLFLWSTWRYSLVSSLDVWDVAWSLSCIYKDPTSILSSLHQFFETPQRIAYTSTHPQHSRCHRLPAAQHATSFRSTHSVSEANSMCTAPTLQWVGDAPSNVDCQYRTGDVSRLSSWTAGAMSRAPNPAVWSPYRNCWWDRWRSQMRCGMARH